MVAEAQDSSQSTDEALFVCRSRYHVQLLHDLNETRDELFAHIVHTFAEHGFVDAVRTLFPMVLGDSLERVPGHLGVGNADVVANELAHVV